MGILRDELGGIHGILRDELGGTPRNDWCRILGMLKKETDGILRDELGAIHGILSWK